MKIQWLGHACFRITEGDYSIVIDPYNSPYVPGYAPLDVTADMVLVSHDHYGHNNTASVHLTGRSESECPIEIESFAVDHDSVGAIMRGSCKVHIFKAGGVKVAHMSDIGTQLNGGEVTKLLNLDAMMVTAGSLTGLPSQEIERMYAELIPTVLIPMHYRDGERGSRRLEGIKDLENRFDDPSFFKYYDTDTIEIDGHNEPQIAVLKYMGKQNVKTQFPKFHR